MPTSTGTIVRTVAGREELNAVFRLRHEAYLPKGYISPRPSGTMSDEWDELLCTVHFIALKKVEVIGAVRLVLDSAKGLPMEHVFSAEIGRLRDQGRRLAKASALVTAEDRSRTPQGTWLALCKAVWNQAEEQNLDDLCIAVTPNHLGFYKRLLFECLGAEKLYEALNGILAHPLRLQVSRARAKHVSSSCPRAATLLEGFLRPCR